MLTNMNRKEGVDENAKRAEFRIKSKSKERLGGKGFLGQNQLVEIGEK